MNLATSKDFYHPDYIDSDPYWECPRGGNMMRPLLGRKFVSLEVGKRFALIVFVMLFISILPLARTVGGPVGEDIFHSALSPDKETPTGIIYPEPNAVVPIQVTNPSPFERLDEVVWYHLILRDFQLFDASQVYVRDAGTGAEILSGALASTAVKYPSSAIREIDVVFQDDFGPNETKSYQVVAGLLPSLTGDMTVSTAGSYIYVNDGPRQYEIQTSHELAFWSQGVYVAYTNGSSVRARSSILVRVGGNQLVLDQTNFQLAWGPPSVVKIDEANCMVSIYLEYRNPIMVNWGFGMSQDLYKNVDTIHANVRINIYNDRPLIETFTEKKINEKFHNHNGFVMEFSVLYAGHGEYQTIFGNSNYTITKGKTLDYYWERRSSSSFDGIDAGNFSSPTFGDLDNDADFDLVMGEESGTLLYWQNTGSNILPQWTSDPTMFAALGDMGNNTGPDLADLDDDGDLDLIIGLKDGILLYYENDGTPFNPSWSNQSASYSGIDVGNYSKPKLADLDGDGDLDLSIGEEYGAIVYYENTGDATIPEWTKNDTLFRVLNTGNTKKPGLFSAPEFADADADGDIDFMSGTDEAPYMAVNLFLNTGTTTDPNFSKLRPDMMNTVRGGATDGTRDHSVPEMVDLDDDGDLDFAIGFSNGEVVYWENMGLYKAESAVNTMDPLPNGSYRFYKDQDSNDGQYVIENYSEDFYDYYVVANPETGAAILRYIPDFAEQVYRDKYAGDEYPWAGGNVSFYPFIPEEDGYVTRGIALSRVFYDPTAGANDPGMMGGTFLSQTGTAAGFIQVPMTAMNHQSREVLLLEMPYTTDYSYYDLQVERLKAEMIVSGLVDLEVTSRNIVTTPTEPEEGDLVILEASVENKGQEPAYDVTVEIFDGDPDLGGTQIGSAVNIETIDKDSSRSAMVAWDTTGKSGAHDIFVRVDYANTLFELDEQNNNATREVFVTNWYKNWGTPIQITDATYNDFEATLVEDSNGRMWIAWHTYTTEDNFDIFTKNYSSDTWSQIEPVGIGIKRTSRPSLAADDLGNVWMSYASNIVEYNDYIATKHAKYYWSQKFDIYAQKFDGTQWQPETRISFAEVLDHSDNTPWVIVTSSGDVWVTYRHTHFQFYTAGHQMDNIPYQDMNVTAVMYNGTAWSGQMVVDDSQGSQGWWGGPRIVEDNSGNPWVIYGSEVMNQQWEIFACMWNGTAWEAPIRLTNSPGNDVRPSATVDANGNIWVAWESMRTGDKNIFIKMFNGTDWSSDLQLTTDAGWDIKSSLAADRNGDVWVAWESDRTGNKDIFLKRYNSSQWSHDIQVTDNPKCDQEVAIHAGDVTGNVYLAWETDRNGHGNLDVYMRILNPTTQPETTLGPARDLPLTIQGQDVRLDWMAPVHPDLDHYLIYRSENQTDFDFSTPHHDTSGDPNPLNLSWIDPGASGPAAPQKLFYTIRAVDSSGNTAFTNRTIGKWTKSFNQGLNVFSLPLEPFSYKKASFYVNDIPNAQYIAWMDSNGNWVVHEKGMGPGVNDATLEMGNAYEIYLSTSADYVFTGTPASTIRHRDGFGDVLADRYSLVASVTGPDVTLVWTRVPGAEYYLLYKSPSRSRFQLDRPTYIGGRDDSEWIDRNGVAWDGEYYYMVIPLDENGNLGSSSYSVAVLGRTFSQGTSTFALEIDIDTTVTLADICIMMPDVVGLSYLTNDVWKFHTKEMPAGVYDSAVQIASGYQISVAEATIAIVTFVGW